MGSARAKQDYFVMDLGKSKKSLRLILITVLLLGFSHASAQEAGAVGTVTNLPLPRFVSLNASEANVRRGPSLNHRIDWVFVRKGTPLQITGEYGHWRQVQDIDGAGGWVHYSFLSGTRMVIVNADRILLFKDASEEADQIAYAERGVVARLHECLSYWCRIEAENHKGWTQKENLWGVAPDELRD